MAAAIGSRQVEEVERKAGHLLRFITLDKLTRDEMAEKKPNVVGIMASSREKKKEKRAGTAAREKLDRSIELTLQAVGPSRPQPVCSRRSRAGR